MIEEDEDVVDTWYLLGWLNKLRADFEREPNNQIQNVDKSKDESSSFSKLPPQEDDVAEGYIGNARFYLKKAMSVHRKNPTDDSELVNMSKYYNRIGIIKDLSNLLNYSSQCPIYSIFRYHMYKKF